MMVQHSHPGIPPVERKREIAIHMILQDPDVAWWSYESCPCLSLSLSIGATVGPWYGSVRSDGERVARGRDGSSIAVAMNHGSASCWLESNGERKRRSLDVDSRRFARARERRRCGPTAFGGAKSRLREPSKREMERGIKAMGESAVCYCRTSEYEGLLYPELPVVRPAQCYIIGTGASYGGGRRKCARSIFQK